jgi:protein-tyrosine-phosphatase
MPISILFVCIGNACRSQMAEGLARHLGGGRVLPFSCGSRPAGFVAPQAVKVLAEKGIDISGQFSKGIDQVPQKSFDYVVTMGCGDACPIVSAKQRIDWQIPDPIGESEIFFREIRDQIER